MRARARTCFCIIIEVEVKWNNSIFVVFSTKHFVLFLGEFGKVVEVQAKFDSENWVTYAAKTTKGNSMYTVEFPY